MNRQDQHKTRKVQKERLNTYARYSGIAIQMLIIIAIGAYAGIKLDEKHPNKHNIYSIVFSFSAVIIAIIFVIRRILAASKKDS